MVTLTALGSGAGTSASMVGSVVVISGLPLLRC